MTLRARLVFATILVSGVALLGLNVTVYRFVSKNLYERLDEQVREISGRFGLVRFRMNERPGLVLGDGAPNTSLTNAPTPGGAIPAPTTARLSGTGAVTETSVVTRARLAPAGDDAATGGSEGRRGRSGDADPHTTTADANGATRVSVAPPVRGAADAEGTNAAPTPAAGIEPVTGRADPGGRFRNPNDRLRPDRPGLPAGEVYTEVRDTNGTIVGDPRIFSLEDNALLRLRLPDPLPKATPTGTMFTVSASGGSSSLFRVAYVAVNLNDGRSFNVITGLPAAELAATLERLRTIQIVATLAVLLAIATGAWVAVRLSLRPLGGIESAARTIAGGDLSHRIGDENPRTEIGRLGQSLNAMMGRIQDAFAEQEASEAQLQRFLADASHELRTPLTAVRGYAQFHRRSRGGLDEETDHAMTRIEDASTRMARIVEDLLAIARHQSGAPLELVPLRLDEMLANVVEDAHMTAPTRVVHLRAEPVLVSADRERLHRAFANIVDNALIHTPPSAEVVVTLERAPGFVTVTIADSGRGIAPEHVEHLFEPFYRADPARSRNTGGTGLGLAIAAATIDAHNGRISVESTEGVGTTFRVELPEEISTPASPAVAAAPFGPVPTERESRASLT